MQRLISAKLFNLAGKNILLGAICAVGALGVACSPESAKAKRNDAAVASGPAWNWESYQPKTRMRVAQLPCQLQPKSTITVVSPISGLLRIYAPGPQSELKAGFLWGEFEPEILAQDEIMLAESLKKLEDLERVQWEIEYPRKKRELELKVKEAEREFKRVEMFANNPDLARLALGAGSLTNVMRPETL